MNLVHTLIADVKILEPRVFEDDRGSFMETWNAQALANLGLSGSFVQDNQSRSRRGVLRGLHFQRRQPQGKLTRVVAGAVFDVVVDIRRSSPTFGKWVGFELSARNRRQLWIPPGMAHGFLNLEDETEFLYKCTAPYAPDDQACLRWDDPQLAIDWPLDRTGPPIVLARDAMGQSLAELDCFP